MPLFYVKIRKNIDICNYLPTYYPAICRGWGTFSVPSLGEGAPLKRPQTQQVETPAPWGGLGRGFGLLEMTLAGSYLLIRGHVTSDTSPPNGLGDDYLGWQQQPSAPAQYPYAMTQPPSALPSQPSTLPAGGTLTSGVAKKRAGRIITTLPALRCSSLSLG